MDRHVEQEGAGHRGPTVEERQGEERPPAHPRQGEEAPEQGRPAGLGEAAPPSEAAERASLDE